MAHLTIARPGRVVALAAVAGLGVALALEAAIAGPSDTAGDTGELLAPIVAPLLRVAPAAIAVLVLTSLVHHLAAAGAARAASGRRLPRGELFAATYAAAAANRLTPAGLGGAAVLGRFFVRRGQLRTPEAAAAVSALAVLGALADIAAFALIIAAGAVFGVRSMVAEAPRLISMLLGVVPTGALAVVVPTTLAVLAVVTVVVLRRRSAAVRSKVVDAARSYRDQLALFARRPLRLLGLLAGSSGTTLVLAAGFAVTATLPPAGLPASTIGAVLIGYMVAAAAGSALPTPGGVGSVDAALVGVLVVDGVPATGAITTVLAFRLVTFWAPALAGLPITRTLRRRGAL